MKLKLLSSLLFFFGILNAQTPAWQWVQKGEGLSYDHSNSTCSDTKGNIYIAGGFGCCEIAFGTDTLTASGTYNILLAKYNSNGNYIWGKAINGNSNDFANSVCCDKDGNIYVTGFFSSDSISFDSITIHNYNSAHFRDIFIAKFDSLGNVLWAKNIGGKYNDGAQSIYADAQGYIYFCGYYSSDTLLFDTIPRINFWPGSNNIFVAKYTAAGNAVWVKSFGGNYSEIANGLTTDSKGNVFFTGNFEGHIMVFGSYILQRCCITTNCYDYFAAKLDSSGNVVWAKGSSGQGNGLAGGNSTCADSKDNLYVTGSFGSSTIILDSITLYNNNSLSYFGDDAFIVKYDSLGNILWASRAGGQSYEGGYHIITDKNDDVYLAGYADENVMTFGTKSITSNFFGGFVSKYNSRGTPMWAKGLYGSGKGICLDTIRSVYVTGDYRWPIAYFGSYSVTNNNTSNITNLYLAKLDSSASGLLLNSSFASADFTETITTSPNPFSNTIFIKIENQNIKSISINIRNTLGEFVFIQNENKPHTPFTKQLDLSFLSGGIYFLEVITDGERLVKKVVKE